MTGEPSADSMSLERSLVKNLQASGLVVIRELISMDGIACDSGRTNAHKGNIRGTKCAGRDRLRGGQIVYAAVWLLNE